MHVLIYLCTFSLILLYITSIWWPFENHCKMKWLPSINKAFIIIIIIILYFSWPNKEEIKCLCSWFKPSLYRYDLTWLQLWTGTSLLDYELYWLRVVYRWVRSYELVDLYSRQLCQIVGVSWCGRVDRPGLSQEHVSAEIWKKYLASWLGGRIPRTWIVSGIIPPTNKPDISLRSLHEHCSWLYFIPFIVFRII